MTESNRKLFGFPGTFWTANVMELFERWAWYGMFILLALYFTGSTDEGALGFTQGQKGLLMGTVVGILYVLPTITGAVADKFGYKRILILSYIILGSGYLLMGYVTTYASMFLAFLYLALGAGLFKPVISATITKTTTEKTASIGFGIFYMIVNIGAFVGPVVASKLREIDWQYAFWMSSGAILVNIILVMIFYKEPERERVNEPLSKTIRDIFINLGKALTDYKLVVFLLIIVGFWTMYNQLFFTLPVFIEQWVNTSGIYNWISGFWPWLANFIGTDDGKVNPEMIVNIDALYIVLFQVLVSSLIMRFKPVNTIITGFLISSIGIALWFVTQNGFYLFLSILIFAAGEMASSPRILEYIGKIAPKDKVAMYMGTYYLPLAGGNFLAGILSGDVYTKMSDKYYLLSLEVQKRGLDIPAISDDFSKNEYLSRACELTGMSPAELTNFLWTTYQPSNIWMLFTGIGLSTVVLLFLYDRLLLKTR
ncbi:MAG: MFS transporter [Bacteroidales bacterium]|jgi:dipeptide/tripeptide permease|nr:MFS transporter [Bacteroidales bacterium]